MPELEREEAVSLIKEGYSPIPLAYGEKMPPKGFYYSEMVVDTEEKARLIYWGKVRVGWAGIGIHPGRSNVWVMDVDGEEGFAELKELTDKYGELPETRTVISGRIGGGMHFYWDATGLEIHSGKITDCEKIDVKGNVGNGIAVVPPSLHKSGKRYEYKNRCKPAVAPEWLINLAKKVKEPKTIGNAPTFTGSLITDEYGLDCMEIGAPIDAHETETGYQGCHPFHGSTTGKDTSNNFSINTKENTWYCFAHQSGGGALELYAVKTGIIDCEKAGKGCLNGKIPEILRSLRADGYISRTQEENKMVAETLLAGEAEKETADELADQYKEAVADFIVDEKIKAARITAKLPPFPGVPSDIPLFHDYVKVMSEITYSLPEFHFASLLPLISMAIGRRAFIEVGASKVYCNVFVMVAGVTTISGKSVACNSAVYKFKESIEYKDTIEGMPANNTVVETDSITAPAVTQILSDTPTVLWYYDDCRPFFYDAAGHNKSIIPDLCKIYDGTTTSIKYSAKGKEGQTKYICKDPYLSLLFNTTVSNIEEVANEKLSENGFFPRFLWFLGEGGHPRKNVKRTDKQKEEIERISAEIKEIADEIRSIPTKDADDSAIDGVAFQINDKIEQWRLDQDLKYIDNEDWHAIIGRGFIHAYKLAAIFTLLDKDFRKEVVYQPREKYPMIKEIPDKYAEAALNLLNKYLIPRALHISELTKNNDMKNKQNLVIKCIKKLGGATSRRDLLRASRLTTSELQTALNSLGQDGSGEISIENKRTGGRKLEFIILNKK